MARKIAGDLDDIYRLLRNDEQAVSGKLSVNVPSGIASRVMAPELPSFLARHPALELNVGSCDRIVDLFKEGVDCVIRVGDPPDDSLVHKPLGKLEMVNCASRAYLAANRGPECPDDLAHHWAVGYSPSIDGQAAAWRCADETGVGRVVPMRYRLTVNSVDSYLACCLAGLGLIQVPRFDVRDMLASGELVEIMPGWPATPVPVSALYLYRNQRSRRLAAFVDWFKDVLDRAMA